MNEDADSRLGGIKGWLYLPALGLIWAPIGFVLTNIVPLFRDHGSSRLIVNYPFMIADLLVLLLVAMVSVFFFRKKRIAPAVYILYILTISMLWNLVDGCFESQNDPPLIAMIVGCMVFFPYMTRSKRVQATFVVDLSEDHPVDRAARCVAPALERFYALLRRARWWILLWAMGYVILTILINCAARSIRIDGTIMKMFDYL